MRYDTLPIETLSEFDIKALRSALGSYATGVAVVSARSADGETIGLTVNSFASVSLDPPLVLWSLALSSPNIDAFKASSHYAVNILAADQTDISQQFASRQLDKFAGLECCEGLGGAPLLPRCCAWFECRNTAQYPGGDHVILLGHVERFAVDAARAPLLFHGGRYAELAGPSN
jgi:flavin reductase (DIM6/NTAB) family NADH-FMN oxidoreductase RutF